MQSFPASCYVLPPRAEYSPQEPVIHILNLCASLEGERSSFTHTKTAGKTIGFFLYVLYGRSEDRF
jgi:hypothetical protein